MAGNSYFLLKTHHKNPCNDACVSFSLEPKLQCVTSQLPRSVCTTKNKEPTNTGDTPRNRSHNIFCPRPWPRAPFGRSQLRESSPERLGSPIWARRRQLPHFTQSFIGNRTKPNACFTPRRAQKCDNSVIVHNPTAYLINPRHWKTGQWKTGADP